MPAVAVPPHEKDFVLYISAAGTIECKDLGVEPLPLGQTSRLGRVGVVGLVDEAEIDGSLGY